MLLDRIRSAPTSLSHSRSPFPGFAPRVVVATFVGLRVVALVAGILELGERPIVDDYLARYVEIATAPGQAYEDFAVEYLPGQYLLIEALGSPDLQATGVRVALLAFIADLATAAILFRRWGPEAAAWYLVLGAPLLLFSYGGVDLVPCVLAVGAVAAALTSRDRLGGVLLASAVLTRGWPLFVLPFFLITARWRAFRWALGGLALGTAAWVSAVGPDAVSQVTTFRGADGWEFESVIGTIAWIAGAAPNFESGAFRLGTTPGWSILALGSLALALIVSAWWRAHDDHALGPVTLASVGAVLLLSPLFSFPFVIWLIPWCALACVVTGDRRVAYLSGAVAALTFAAVTSFPSKEELPLLTQSLLLARDAAVAGTVIWSFAWLGISSCSTTPVPSRA